MKPFSESSDDLFPEENDARQREMVTLLQKALPKQAALAGEEQEQILARVRGRLLSQDQIVPTDEDFSAQPVGIINSFAHTSPSIYSRRVKPGSSIIRGLNTFAAVLVVGALVSASLLLFVHHVPVSSRSPVSPVPLNEGVTSSADGLSMSLRLTSGPYFLSEMLAADIMLTNHTQKPFFVGLPFVKSICGYSSGVAIIGGNKPDYIIPIPTDHRCHADSNNTNALEPGQTLTVHKYLPLTSSGKQTLTAETTFYSISGSGQNSIASRISHPLAEHWPTVQIDVKPDIPSNRKLTFQLKGTQATVQSSVGVPSHLVYLYGISCQDYNGVGISGNYGWQEISTNTVSEPACPTKNVHWQFAFGAPGYAVIIGSSPSS
jgi:hypothetical protein